MPLHVKALVSVLVLVSFAMIVDTARILRVTFRYRKEEQQLIDELAQRGFTGSMTNLFFEELSKLDQQQRLVKLREMAQKLNMWGTPAQEKAA